MQTLIAELAAYPIHVLILGSCVSVAMASLLTHLLLAAGVLRSRLLPGLLLGLAMVPLSAAVQGIAARLLLGSRLDVPLEAVRDVVFLVALLAPTAVPIVVLSTSAHAAVAIQEAGAGGAAPDPAEGRS